MSTRPGSTVPSSPVFPVLDTLRGVGALAVLTTHVAFQSGAYVRHGAFGPLLARLDIGVALFFVLSGFLLARPYVAAAGGSQRRPDTRTYLRKRFWRIYPLYAVSVVLALLVVRGNDAGDVGVWLRALTMTDVYTSHPLPQGLTQMWSLAVEVSFYVLLPPLMWLLLGRRGRPPRRARVVAVLGAAVLLSLAWNLGLADPVRAALPGAPALWLPAHLTWFVVGVALALVDVAHRRGSRSAVVDGVVALGRQPGVCWTVAGGLLLVAATPLGGPVLLQVATPTQSVVKHLLYALVAGLVVLTGVVADERSRYARTLSWPALRRVGVLSYGVFCLHLVVLDLVRRLLDHRLFTGDGLQLWVLTVVGSLAAAWLLHRLVERPGMRVGHTGVRRGGRVLEADASSTSTSAATTR